MKTIKVNGKAMPQEEALDLIARPEVTIQNVKITYPNPDKEKSPPSHEGFEIKQELISAASKKMSAADAGYMKFSFCGSSKIMNRDLFLVMIDRGYQPKWKRWVISALERLL